MIILFLLLLFWIFVLRKELLITKQEKNKSGIYNAINSLTNTQGWIIIIFIPILIIISIVEEWPSLSIIFNIFGISICDYNL